jgi:hypothetical protein
MWKASPTIRLGSNQLFVGMALKRHPYNVFIKSLGQQLNCHHNNSSFNSYRLRRQ